LLILFLTIIFFAKSSSEKAENLKSEIETNKIKKNKLKANENKNESEISKTQTETKTNDKDALVENFSNSLDNNLENETRAVWVTFMSLDMKDTRKDEEAFIQKINNMVKEIKENKLNTVFMHVRSHSDSLYPSKIYPWSEILTDTQGKDPGYDPLRIMIEICHNNGLKIHAWLNPFRVRLGNIPKSVSKEHPFCIWQKSTDKELEDACVEISDREKFFNPASAKVRKLVIDGVKEIVTNYQVDGIHIDDYFYPTEKKDYDKTCYNRYTEKIKAPNKPLSIEEFRRANINSLVSEIYTVIKFHNPNIKFGVSPTCNIDYDETTGADVISWTQNYGYIDYICPEVYMNFNNPKFPYEKTVQNWKNLIKCKNLELYIGLGVYKAGSNLDNGTWKNENNILAKEIKCGREIGCNGFALYSFDSLTQNTAKDEVINVVKMFSP
jgi:uncharacterized lipoprotein YddW (UPF0748 family)